MLIITLEDLSFPQLATAWRDGTVAGQFWRKETVHIVCITPTYVLVSDGEDPRRLAIKPTKNIDEARDFAKQLLSKEVGRGNRVEFANQVENKR